MRIVVIGGGPSGIVSAIMAKNNRNEVIILEKNDKPLKKLLLTGNGRCNYLHEDYSLDKFHSDNIRIVEEFITYNNIKDAEFFFDSIGIIPKNKNGYIYPVTNQAVTVYDALYRKAKEVGVEFIFNTNVTSIRRNSNNFAIDTDEKTMYCDKLVLATGGCAYPKTGSTGDGYKFLEGFGHTIIQPLPALVQLISDNPYLKEWDGVRIDAILTLEEDGIEIKKESGELQLTDYGISGICTFNLSQFVSRGLFQGKKEIIKINFVPFIETLITTFLDRYNSRNNYNDIKELLEGFLPKKIVPIVLKTAKLDDHIKYNDLNSEEKIRLGNYLKEYPLNIIDTKGFENSQVCNGGLSLNEINIETMESRIIPGLYIVGELLDISGDCGGYNLTSCWISGILAGRSLGEENDTY